MKKTVLIIFMILLCAIVAGIIISQKNTVKLPGDVRCSLVPEQGPCEAIISKYYFDQMDNVCKQFSWGGCGGTVPFETLEECKPVCE